MGELVVFDKEYYTKQFEAELDKELFALNQSEIFNKKLSELEVMENVSTAFKIPINKEFEGRCQFAVDAENEWRDFGNLAKELIAFISYYKETCFTLNSREFVDNFKLPSMIDIAYCMRPDLNYAILRWHGGHKRVENRIRKMKLIDLYHPIYGEGQSKDGMLYLEHGTIWQFKALPAPSTQISDAKLSLLGQKIDTMFLPEAVPTQDMIDPTSKVVKNKPLTKK